MKIFHYITFLTLLFCTVITAPQSAETKDKLELTNQIADMSDTQNEKENSNKEREVMVRRDDVDSDNSLSIKMSKFFTDPINRIIATPKVNEILRNIGTCIVNGALELASFYLPPAFMPLIASAAGLVIPFEPVVMLKERMPVTSYRRAFDTAMNSFLRTFDKYKVGEEYDPYMTRRFNRRFMDDGDEKKKENEI